jgi:2-hydroxy-3-oxopropionate reductase
MTTVAFLGLGIMGAPMAENLVTAGFDVVGFSRRRDPIERLVAHGGRGAHTVAEATSVAEAVITMVPDGPDVTALALGPDGFYPAARPGTLHIDCSTIPPQTSRRLAESGAAHGIRVLDAPVSGGEAGAVEGTLSIMAGGAADDFEAARPILEAMGRTVLRVGEAGAGQTVKAANQLVVAGTIQLLAEALVFLQAHGTDLDAAVRVLAGGLAGSTVLDRKAGTMLTRDFTPGFRVDLHHKDLGILISAARDADVIVPLGAHVAQLMAALRSRGHGELDHTALLLLAEELSGRVPNTPTPCPMDPADSRA